MLNREDKLVYRLQEDCISPPFYIVVSSCSLTSGSSVFLLDLCRYLNAIGHRAFIVQYPAKIQPIKNIPHYANLQTMGRIPNNLFAPFITQEIIDFYDNRQILPIVIYEDIIGNPLNADFYGNFISSKKIHENCCEISPHQFIITENVFALKEIAQELRNKIYSLDIYLPMIEDLQFWILGEVSLPSRGACFYLGQSERIPDKFKHFLPDNSLKICDNDLNNCHLLREYFHNCEIFFCLNYSPLIYLAILSGCPVAVISTDEFSRKFIENSGLLNKGIWLLPELDSIERMRVAADSGKKIILQQKERFLNSVRHIAQELKSSSVSTNYKNKIDYPYSPYLVLFDSNIDTHGNSDITYSPRYGDQVLDFEELPYVMLPHTIISNIAREVMFEQQRWSVRYKMKLIISEFIKKIFSLISH